MLEITETFNQVYWVLSNIPHTSKWLWCMWKLRSCVPGHFLRFLWSDSYSIVKRLTEGVFFCAFQMKLDKIHLVVEVTNVNFTPKVVKSKHVRVCYNYIWQHYRSTSAEHFFSKQMCTLTQIKLKVQHHFLKLNTESSLPPFWSTFNFVKWTRETLGPSVLIKGLRCSI